MPADGSPAPVELDQQARVALAHAAVEALACGAGVDLLHVKGPALEASLRRPGRESTDADVLVRPAHVEALLAALAAHGWRRVTGFATGSPFQHAANWHHDFWGYVDVHRSFPGLGGPAALAFDRLWSERGSAVVAHRDCLVPSVRDQGLLVCLHAARGLGDARARADLDHAWWAATPQARAQLRSRAAELGAQVALAAATDELDTAGGTPAEVALWRYFSRGGTRLEEWRARFRAAPGLRARAGVAVRALGVNREYEAMVLGREPTSRELWARRRARAATAFSLLIRRRGR